MTLRYTQYPLFHIHKMWQYLLALLFSSIFVCNSAYAAEVEINEAETSKHTLLINLSGTIEPGDLFKLQYVLATIPETKSRHIARRKIYLDSTGGNLEEAFELGRFFRQYSIRTIIRSGAECKSACAIAFLGGTSENPKTLATYRMKSSLGVLGFHSIGAEAVDEELTQAYIKEVIAQSQSTFLDLLEYFLEMDADPRILKAMLTTPKEDYYYIDNAEALEFCIHVFNEDFSKNSKQAIVNPYQFRFAAGKKSDNVWKRSTCKYKKR